MHDKRNASESHLINRKELLQRGFGLFALLAIPSLASSQEHTHDTIQPLDTVQALYQELQRSMAKRSKYGPYQKPEKTEKDDFSKLVTQLRLTMYGELIDVFRKPYDSKMTDISLPLRKGIWDTLSSIIGKERAQQYGSFTPEKLPVFMLRELPQVLADRGIAVLWAMDKRWDEKSPVLWIKPYLYEVKSSTDSQVSLGEKSVQVGTAEVVINEDISVPKDLEKYRQFAFGFSNGGTAHLLVDKIADFAESINAKVLEGMKSLPQLNESERARFCQILLSNFLNKVAANPTDTDEYKGPAYAAAILAQVTGLRAWGEPKFTSELLAKKFIKTHEHGHCAVEMLNEGSGKMARTLDEMYHYEERDAHGYEIAYAPDDGARYACLGELIDRAMMNTQLNSSEEAKQLSGPDDGACYDVVRMISTAAREHGYAKDLFELIDNAKLDEKQRFAAHALLLTSLSAEELKNASVTSFENRLKADEKIAAYDHPPSPSYIVPAIVGTTVGLGIIGAWAMKYRKKHPQTSTPSPTDAKPRAERRREEREAQKRNKQAK